MPFVDKQNPKWIAVPGEGGAEFGFAGLSGGELDEAQVRNIERSLEMNISEGMGKALIDPDREKDKDKDEDKPITFGDCNDAVLVEYGVVGWKGGVYDGRPCDTANRKLLTAEVFRWAARQAFDASVLTAGEGSTSEPSGRDGGDQNQAGRARTSSPSSTPAPSSPVASR